MLRSLTAKQFREWEIFARLEPFSEARADYRAASIVQVIANTMGRGKNDPPFKLEDFVLKFKEEELVDDVEEATSQTSSKLVPPQRTAEEFEQLFRVMFGVPSEPENKT